VKLYGGDHCNQVSYMDVEGNKKRKRVRHADILDEMDGERELWKGLEVVRGSADREARDETEGEEDTV